MCVHDVIVGREEGAIKALPYEQDSAANVIVVVPFLVPVIIWSIYSYRASTIL